MPELVSSLLVADALVAASEPLATEEWSPVSDAPLAELRSAEDEASERSPASAVEHVPSSQQRAASSQAKPPSIAPMTAKPVPWRVFHPCLDNSDPTRRDPLRREACI
jgi:hypothetical protein